MPDKIRRLSAASQAAAASEAKQTFPALSLSLVAALQLSPFPPPTSSRARVQWIPPPRSPPMGAHSWSSWTMPSPCSPRPAATGTPTATSHRGTGRRPRGRRGGGRWRRCSSRAAPTPAASPPPSSSPTSSRFA